MLFFFSKMYTLYIQKKTNGVFCCCFFEDLYIYIQKEQTVRLENDHVTRKSHGYIDWILALGFIMCKEAPSSFYKIEFANELDK
jgi:hypothetical protein